MSSRINPQQVVLCLLASAILTLYLAPSEAKLLAANGMSLALLIALWARYRPSAREIGAGLQPLWPLLPLAVFALGQELWGAGGSNQWYRYTLALANGVLPYLSFHLMLSRNSEETNTLLPMGLLVIPGLVHLGFFGLDILQALHQDDPIFTPSSRHGLLEHVKDVPRVGRRYLSIALLHLLIGGVLVAWLARAKRNLRMAWVLIAISAAALAVLDARAAYVSLAIGGVLLGWSLRGRLTSGAQAWVRRLRQGQALMVLFALALLLAVAYNAGKSRWLSMHYSFQAAHHDVFLRSDPKPMRPYVDIEFWNAPIADIDRCYLAAEFRCAVDQSAYLRMAWLLSALEAAKDHPWGIGYSEDYMGRLWGVQGQSGKFQRADSFLIEQLICFGWMGLACLAALIGGVCATLRRLWHSQPVCDAVAVAAAAAVLVSFGRSLVDVMDDGFWQYLMALMGIYYGRLRWIHLQRERP